MPVLENPRHEIFAQHIAKGSSQREAYRAAGYSAKTDAAVDTSASRLLSDVEVKARIAELQGKMARKLEVTIESLVAELEEARLLGLAVEQPAAMVAATMGKAKITGNVIDRKEVGKPGAFEELTDDELQQQIVEQTKELADLDPNFAAELAAREATKH